MEFNSARIQMLCKFTSPGPGYVLRLPFERVPRAGSLAIYAAYRAYLHPESLKLATDLWDAVSVYQITQENASNGMHPLKSGSFNMMCNGGTIFHRENPSCC